MTLRARQSEEPAHPVRVETRWPVAFAVLAVTLLLTMLPDRVRVAPVWAPYVLAIALIVPMAAIMLTSAPERWFRIERTILLIFFVVAGIGMIADLTRLIAEMVRCDQVVAVN